jgi:hypothetical protein
VKDQLPYHRIIKQKLISPKFLKLVYKKDTIHFEPDEWDYYRGQFKGMTRNEVDQRFSERKKEAEKRAAMSEEEKIQTLANDLNMDPDALAQRIQLIEDMPENAVLRIVGDGAELKIVFEDDEPDRDKK